ncbi:hypothetical protein H4Q26_013537 [Puccinia striiformis f. sp. tritici PST-130]|nr:hypothetical protein H4Q26_013537 [Puccinia striiformis f. sp. tritici PST-130]
MAKLVSPSLPFVIVHPPGYITGQPRPSDHQVHPAPATVAASWALADPLISHFPANASTTSLSWPELFSSSGRHKASLLGHRQNPDSDPTIAPYMLKLSTPPPAGASAERKAQPPSSLRDTAGKHSHTEGVGLIGEACPSQAGVPTTSFRLLPGQVEASTEHYPLISPKIGTSHLRHCRRRPDRSLKQFITLDFGIPSSRFLSSFSSLSPHISSLKDPIIAFLSSVFLTTGSDMLKQLVFLSFWYLSPRSPNRRRHSASKYSVQGPGFNAPQSVWAAFKEGSTNGRKLDSLFGGVYKLRNKHEEVAKHFATGQGSKMQTTARMAILDEAEERIRVLQQLKLFEMEAITPNLANRQLMEALFPSDPTTAKRLNLNSVDLSSKEESHKLAISHLEEVKKLLVPHTYNPKLGDKFIEPPGEKEVRQYWFYTIDFYLITTSSPSKMFEKNSKKKGLRSKLSCIASMNM